MDEPTKVLILVFGVMLSLLLMSQAMPHHHMVVAKWPEFTQFEKILAVVATVIIDLVCLLPGVGAGMAFVWMVMKGV